METTATNLNDRIDDLEDADSLDPDSLLMAFIDWVSDQGISLYEAQEEAILELMTGRHVILKTPTGSGKSLVATAMHFRSLALDRRSFYTSPIKALVSEKFFKLCQDFSPENVGMMTGDSSINRDAPIICCTAEVLANMALREGADADVDDVVMDEFHYYSDRDRGSAWQIPLLTLPKARFLLMSATLGDTEVVEKGLEAMTGESVAIVSSNQRPVPLEFSYVETPVHETLEDLVKANRAPIYQVNFTQRACAEQAQNLMSVNFASKEEKKAIAAAIRGRSFDTPYGKDIQKYVKHGIGVHHGGLLPKYRFMVEQLSQKGLLKVICGTDTLGVGVNVPLRTVLFTKLCKFDGEQVRILSVRDFKQIAGRAGRKGFDDRGYVVCQAPEHVIENKRAELKAASSVGKKKKFVRKKPPTKGYKHWDQKVFESLQQNHPEPLTPVFDVSHGMLLNLMRRTDPPRGGGYRLLVELIDRCHLHAGAKRHLRRRARRQFKALVTAGILDIVPSDQGRGSTVEVSSDLQDDFSLMHTLSLYLLEALEQLDQSSPTYALDLVSVVESILEHPRAILYQQVRRIKDELVANMKAAGVEYEERMERLEKVTWDRPKADFIYRTFNAFAEAYPWVSEENIRPKSIVRAMFEGFHTFNEYVRDLGLERMEGVLLRYLSEAYKTLVQSVPETYRDDAFVDVLAYLRTTLEHVDSSLVEAWERMVLGGDEAAEATPDAPVAIDISRDARTFRARIRSELHLLVKMLAVGDFAGAEAAVRQPDDAPWSAERFEERMAGYLDDYEALVFDHTARMTDKTRITEDGRHRWRVMQVLVDPDGDNLWAIHATVDLTGDTAPRGPLLELERIGP